MRDHHTNRQVDLTPKIESPPSFDNRKQVMRAKRALNINRFKKGSINRVLNRFKEALNMGIYVCVCEKKSVQKGAFEKIKKLGDLNLAGFKVCCNDYQKTHTINKLTAFPTEPKSIIR